MSCLGVWKRDHTLRRQAGWGWFISAATGMSKKQYILICVLSALCLVLVVEEQRLGVERRVWQSQAASLQARIDGSLGHRLGPQRIDALFQDLANTALKNSQFQQWLQGQGFAVNPPPPTDAGPPAPGASNPQP
jgi:hypothetical protein